MTQHGKKYDDALKQVDREELPAVDTHYMQATQALTGHGGWPMSVWLDHERRPWYAGTYFPPVPSPASPSFVQVLLAITLVIVKLITLATERGTAHTVLQ